MDRMKETAVEMRDIVKEMGDHMPEGFPGDHIFLPAMLAVAACDDLTAVQAILLFSLRNMGQRKIFLKNKYKKYKRPFFFVPEQLR
jgi:hypothetical protein